MKPLSVTVTVTVKKFLFPGGTLGRNRNSDRASGFSQPVVSTETVVLQCGDQRFQEVARENVGRSTMFHLAAGSRPSVRPSVRRYRRYHWCVSVVTPVTPP